MKLLGYDKAALMGMKVFDLYADTPYGVPKAQKNFNRFQKGESIWEVELQMRHKDGYPIWVCDRPGPNYGKPYKCRWKFIEGLCKRAGVRAFGYHALQRYVASVLADTYKVSAKQIQRILRNKNLSTTERYIQSINDDLKSTLDLLSQNKIPQRHTPNEKGVNQYNG
jgi:hypothetical protein